MIAVEGGFEHAIVLGNTPALLIADVLATTVSVGVEIDLGAIGRPRSPKGTISIAPPRRNLGGCPPRGQAPSSTARGAHHNDEQLGADTTDGAFPAMPCKAKLYPAGANHASRHLCLRGRYCRNPQNPSLQTPQLMEEAPLLGRKPAALEQYFNGQARLVVAEADLRIVQLRNCRDKR